MSEHFRCKKTDELLVVNEWQGTVYCPNCGHYSKGQCQNPTRKSVYDRCPFDGKELPVKLVDGTDFKFNVGDEVIVEFDRGKVCVAFVVDRKITDFGNTYQVDWSASLPAADTKPWFIEEHLSKSCHSS